MCVLPEMDGMEGNTGLNCRRRELTTGREYRDRRVVTRTRWPMDRKRVIAWRGPMAIYKALHSRTLHAVTSHCVHHRKNGLTGDRRIPRHDCETKQV